MYLPLDRAQRNCARSPLATRVERLEFRPDFVSRSIAFRSNVRSRNARPEESRDRGFSSLFLLRCPRTGSSTIRLIPPAKTYVRVHDTRPTRSDVPSTFRVSRERANLSLARSLSFFLFSHATAYPLAEVGRDHQSCVCVFAGARNFFFKRPLTRCIPISLTRF